MPSYETITPILPPTPTLPNPLQFHGAVMLRCGPVGGPYNNLQLPANPDQELLTDIRVTAIQTLSGLYFDDYGQGITRLTLTGDTAWSSPKGLFNGDPINGYDTAKHLYRDIIQRYFQIEQDKSNPQNAELLIFDYTVNGSWSVKPIPPGIVLSRTKASPMTYAYTISFAVIRDLVNDPASPDMIPEDPVQALIVGTTNAPQSEKIVDNSSSTAPSTAQTAIKLTQAVKQTPNQTYTVVSGDTLWGIATKYYGNGALWPTIWSANKGKVANPNLIFPGQTLIIPPGPNSNAA